MTPLLVAICNTFIDIRGALYYIAMSIEGL